MPNGIIKLHFSAVNIADSFNSRTGSLHQPHLAPAWMHSPQYLALALMHSFPSGWKTKREEEAESEWAVVQHSPCKVSSLLSPPCLHVSSCGTLRGSMVIGDRDGIFCLFHYRLCSVMLRWSSAGSGQGHHQAKVASLSLQGGSHHHKLYVYYASWHQLNDIMWQNNDVTAICMAMLSEREFLPFWALL